jgi:hypothetical protein
MTESDERAAAMPDKWEDDLTGSPYTPLSRIRVPGGWLYRQEYVIDDSGEVGAHSMTFVPDVCVKPDALAERLRRTENTLRLVAREFVKLNTQTPGVYTHERGEAASEAAAFLAAEEGGSDAG